MRTLYIEVFMITRIEIILIKAKIFDFLIIVNFNSINFGDNCKL
jgi:hypothetical protein